MKIKHFIFHNLKALIDGTYPIKRVVDTFGKWNPKQQQQFSESALHDMVSYAYKNVPYYSELFSDHGIDPKQITTFKDLSKIPILTKEIIRTQKDSLTSTELGSIKHTKRRSGGTTGEPIESILSKNATAFETFIFLRELSAMGWNPGMQYLQVFGGNIGVQNKARFRNKVFNLMMNSKYIHPFDLDLKNIHNLKTFFNTKKEICLIGYPSAINNLVDLFREISFKVENVKIVITTSEHLIDDWKSNITEYFNCGIRSYYGCGEVGSLGYQHINQGEDYFIPVEHVILENDNKTDELIITQLHNQAMPLIRYKNGDTGKVSPDFRKINALTGRTADYFQRSDGSKVSPIFGTRSIQDSGIPVSKYQYIQNSDGAIEFRYYMEGTSLNDGQKNIIRNILTNVMKEEVNLQFKSTLDFIVSENGKHRICVKKN